MTNVDGLSFLHKNIWSTTYVSFFSFDTSLTPLCFCVVGNSVVLLS
jgi:hypothetical protein